MLTAATEVFIPLFQLATETPKTPDVTFGILNRLHCRMMGVSGTYSDASSHTRTRSQPSGGSRWKEQVLLGRGEEEEEEEQGCS